MKHNLREVSSSPIIDPKPPRLSGDGWGYVFGALGAILFSMKAIFVKLAYQPKAGIRENEIEAITLMAFRLGFSLPVYIIIFVLAIRKLKADGRPLPKARDLILSGGIGFLMYYCCAFLDIEGLKYITAQLERLLLFTYPVFVLILSVVFLGLRPSFKTLSGIAIAYIGIMVIFAGGDMATGLNVPLGTAMVLGCALLFGTSQLLSKPMITRLGSTVFTCIAMMTAGGVIFAHLLTVNIMDGSLSTLHHMPPRIYVIGLCLAFFSTLLPSFLVNIAIGRIGAQAVATLGLLAPISTIIFAIFLLGEPFGWVDAVGTALTIMGIGVYTYFNRKDQKRLSGEAASAN